MAMMIKHAIWVAVGVAIYTAPFTNHAVAAGGAEAEAAVEMASGKWSSVGWSTLKLAPVRHVLDWVTGADGQLYVVVRDTNLPEYACNTGQQGECPLLGIIKWDGTRWQDVPEPPSSRGDNIDAVAVLDSGAGPAIHALTYRGQLFQLTPSGWQQLGKELRPDDESRYDDKWQLVAAEFAGKAVLVATISRRLVAFWDGTAWTSSDGRFDAILGVGDKLYIGGDSDAAGGERTGFVKSFDGQHWSVLGESLPCAVTALAKGKDARAIYAACDGYRSNERYRVFKWDGHLWHKLPDIVIDGEWSMAVLDGKLYVGGSTNWDNDRNFGPLAVWNGTRWAKLGLNRSSNVSLLYVHDGSLLVAGALHTVDDHYMGRVLKWTPE